MSRQQEWKAWHEVVSLRDDVRSGDLSLAAFAADLYDVAMDRPGARGVYKEPREFFALTYPTYNLRELAKDVVTRLAGRTDKAIRQLALTYGGGKTHTLITLFHLANDPARLPDLPAVREFKEHVGIDLQRARVASLSFDKLDVEKGTEARGPGGETRWVRHPWSVLAFQIAGAEGLRLLSASGTDEERESAPAENLLVELLSLPGREDLATLVLIDEVLMYAREKVGQDPEWLSRIVNFFQYLTQAVTKVDRCAVVASLLATDPAKNDTLGKEIVGEVAKIFRRQSEEDVQPVGKKDVAEVLRRRFFKPESIRDREAFRQHVVAALKGVSALDEQTRKDGAAAEERFLTSYPFHPDLTDIFYTKWTNLEGFQRTRGVLKTFASALRDAEKWDGCPLVSTNVFLSEPGKSELSEAAKQVAGVATSEEYEGKRQEWISILEGELAKAREIEAETTGLRHRELEQAVFATFLHSQPIGHEAKTRDLLLLVGPTRPDRIELEKALRRWTEVSWFLDEGALGMAAAEVGAPTPLPKSWRLGSKPNLRQMHHDAAGRVPPELIEAKLVDEITRLKSLTSGAGAAGATPHTLPDRPNQVEDDGEFHYAVLGPKAASESGKPSAEARKFIDEKTGPDNPRVNRNAILLAVPSRDGLDVARTRIRDYLGWEEVRSQLKGQDLDPIRAGSLTANLEAARRRVPDAIQQAYSVVVTVSEKNEVQAFKITVGGEPLFSTIKADPRSRIQETAVSAEALLPEGPYDLWREGDTARRVDNLVGAFAQFPRLPKMLRRQEVLDTLVLGAREGTFVMRVTRPDRSVRTFWRQAPDEAALRDPTLEVVLPEAAALSEIPPPLLAPGSLPGLWNGEEIRVRDLHDYFSGGRVVQIPREGYEEPVTVPKAEKEVVDAAVNEAVKAGALWLVSGPSSLYREEIPAGIVTDDALLLAPPPPIPAAGVLPGQLPLAWAAGAATALAISDALSQRAGRPLPWTVVSDALAGALRARLLEIESGAFPCDFAAAPQVTFKVPSAPAPGSSPEPPETPGVRAASAELSASQIQDFADQIADLVKAASAAGVELAFKLRVEVGDGGGVPSEEVLGEIGQLLKEVSEDFDFS